jgi:hypothetical protein
MFWDGACLFEGHGVQENQERTQEYLEFAANSNDAYWSRQQSIIYRFGYFGFNKNEKVTDFFEEIADSKRLTDISHFSPGYF